MNRLKPLSKETILGGYESSKLYELIGCIKNYISDDDRIKFVSYLLHPKFNKRYIVGSGRTGNVMKSFAMRLMHLDLGEIYVLGETITPAINRNDLMIAGSGSGKTEDVIVGIKAAKEKGATIIGITSEKDSSLAKLSDCLVYIPVNEAFEKTKKENSGYETKKRSYIENQIRGRYERSKLLGTLFEDTLNIFLDETIEVCLDLLGKTEKDLRSKHI